jgi:hypothetical protein
MGKYSDYSALFAQYRAGRGMLCSMCFFIILYFLLAMIEIEIEIDESL